MKELIRQINSASWSQLIRMKEQVIYASPNELTEQERKILLDAIHDREKYIDNNMKELIKQINSANWSQLKSMREQVIQARSNELTEQEREILLEAIRERKMDMDNSMKKLKKQIDSANRCKLESMREQVMQASPNEITDQEREVLLEAIRDRERRINRDLLMCLLAIGE